MHVFLAVAAHIVDIHVENMSVLLHLPTCKTNKAIPILFIQQFTDLFGPARIQSLADDQEGVVLEIGRGSVQRCCCRLIAQLLSFKVVRPHLPVGGFQFIGDF